MLDAQALETREDQITSLLNLYYHYAKAGAVLDKGQNQADVMRSKMELLYKEIEVRLSRLSLQSPDYSLSTCLLATNHAPACHL